MLLKKVGFYKEFDYGDEHGGSLYELISTIPNPDENKIISYLESGAVFLVCPGFTVDVLSKDDKIITTLATLTDGIWTWPSDLAYYVKEYHIALDKDFVSHMRDNGWTINKEAIDFDELERLNLPR